MRLSFLFQGPGSIRRVMKDMAVAAVLVWILFVLSVAYDLVVVGFR